MFSINYIIYQVPIILQSKKNKEGIELGKKMNNHATSGKLQKVQMLCTQEHFIVIATLKLK